MGKGNRLRRQRDANERAFLAWTSTMCHSCAYRPGTEASRDIGDPGLSVKRAALLKSCSSFQCHEPMPAGVSYPYDDGCEPRKACVGHMNRLSEMRELFDTMPLDELMRRKREARDIIESIESQTWACDCGWIVRDGENCPNPAHSVIGTEDHSAQEHASGFRSAAKE